MPTLTPDEAEEAVSLSRWLAGGGLSLLPVATYGWLGEGLYGLMGFGLLALLAIAMLLGAGWIQLTVGRITRREDDPGNQST